MLDDIRLVIISPPGLRGSTETLWPFSPILYRGNLNSRSYAMDVIPQIIF